MGRSPTSDRVNTEVFWRYFSGHGNGPTVTVLDVSYLRFVQFLICLACCPFYDTEPNYQPLIVPLPVSNSTRRYHQASVNGFSVFYNDTPPTSERVNTVVNWRHFSGHGNDPKVTMLYVCMLPFLRHGIKLPGSHCACANQQQHPEFLICLARCPFYDTEPNYQPLIVPVPVSNSSRTYHQAAENGYSVFYNHTFVCYKRTATSLETSPTSERVNTVVNCRHFSGHGNGPTVTMLDVYYLRFVQFMICLACCPFYDTNPNYQPLIVPVPVCNSTRTYHEAAVNGFIAF
ncbi:hypothetical protein V5799_011268 [Amblyomma americanum]|uniref:Uncharacterized protein n=1 Tax=Amblyomma americanum TaxID=6943 RepID=A0AAQ4EHU8_AMBAM